MTRAIGCISGGLDSLLAVRLMQDQGIDVLGLHVRHLWYSDPPEARPEAVRRLSAEGVPVIVIDAAEADLALVADPQHGFGKNMNPCIDCRIWTLAKAKEMMRVHEAAFVFTGEVVGQRPMSQRRPVMDMIAKRSGLEDLLLRPLSALVLPPTRPEQSGLVERSRLHGFHGRGRSAQMRLAEELGITEYPQPAGGCLLTEPAFAFRLRNLMDTGEPTPNDVELLKVGRHFRLSDGTRIVIGRKHEENLRIEKLGRPGDVLVRARDLPGPTGLVRGHGTTENLELAAEMTLRYGKAEAGSIQPVRLHPVGDASCVIRAQPAHDAVCQNLLLRMDAAT